MICWTFFSYVIQGLLGNRSLTNDVLKNCSEISKAFIYIVCSFLWCKHFQEADFKLPMQHRSPGAGKRYNRFISLGSNLPSQTRVSPS